MPHCFRITYFIYEGLQKLGNAELGTIMQDPGASIDISVDHDRCVKEAKQRKD